MYEKKINLNWILDFIPIVYISNNNNMVLDIDVGHFDMEKMIVKVVGKWRIKRENFFGPFSAIFYSWPPFFYLASFFIPGHLRDHGA